MRSAALALILAAACAGQMPNVSGDRIRAGVKFLSSDLLEGRGVGTRGGELATEFLATEFAVAGAKPAGDNGTYFQKVPLVGVQTQGDSQLAAVGAGSAVPLRYLDDFVGSNERQRALEEFDAEAVFVGFGIVAPEYRWDDYKGADVRGKMLVLFTNEPDSSDPDFFAGRALTYYGRWSYKYEEAVRHGALRRTDGGEVAVRTELAPDTRRMTCVIEDNGPGPASRATRPGALGLGLVTRRLALNYAGAASFRLERVGGHTRSVVELPVDGAA